MAINSVKFDYRPSLQGYLTDGSPIQWGDTGKFQWEDAGKSTRHDRYEFLVDDGPGGNGVPVGNISLDQTQCPTLEAEWIIYFPDGMPYWEKISPLTHVWLTGMAETKYMTGISLTEQYKKGEMPWKAMSLRNNVIAKGECIETTIGDIDEGRVNGEVIVNEVTVSDERLEWKNHAATLCNKNIVEYLKYLAKCSREEHKGIDFVNLGATDERCALVWDKSRQKRAAEKSHGGSLEEILQKMFSDAIDDRHFTKSGELKVIFNGDVIATAHITTKP